jgi:hypothetical protein
MWEHNLLVKWQQRDAQARGSCSWPGSNRGHLYRQPQVPYTTPHNDVLLNFFNETKQP